MTLVRIRKKTPSTHSSFPFTTTKEQRPAKAGDLSNFTSWHKLSRKDTPLANGCALNW